MEPVLRSFTLSLVLLSLFCGSAARAATESIFPDTVVSAASFNEAPEWEFGTVFRPTVPGKITDVRVFSLATESGDHQVRIWRNSDNSVVSGPVTWNFGGDEAWITLDIPDVLLQANEDYTISISATVDGFYPAIGGYFGSAGSNGQNLDYPQGAGVLNVVAGLRPTNNFANTAYLRDVVFEPDLSGTVMRVKGNGNTITDGSATPTQANGTVVGGKSLSGGFREQSYTISNLGQTVLDLNGNPKVSIAGAQAGDFTVTTQPAASVAAGESTTFTIRFDPTALGARTATVSIPRADAAANPYDFIIQGTGLGGGAGVLGNDSDGAFARNIDALEIHGNRFMAPVDMKISELRARVLELTGVFKCAIYSDAQGTAERLLAESVEVVNATNGWNAFPLVSALDVSGGDRYWLVIWSDTQGARVQADPVGVGYFGSYSYFDLSGAWPDPISLTQLLGDAASRTYCIYAEGSPLSPGPGAELDVRGNGKLIVSGDLTPSSLDGSDFGSRDVGDAQERTFTVENRGDSPLTLGSPAVSIAGAQAGDWTVISPPTSPVAPAGSSQFTVSFRPAGPGLRSATLSIASDDADENPYAFAVQGAGVATGRESIFPDTKVGRDIDFDGTYYELGTVFQSSVAGKITQLRVYALASESGDHTARIWRNDDEEIIGGPYTWNYGGAVGWITMDIPDVDIDAATDYTVSVSTGTSAKRNYPNIAGYFSAAGDNGKHLSFPLNAGVFTDVRDGRPTQSFNNGNYLRDVVFVPAGVVVDVPDMDLKGKDTPIADGDASPSNGDGTDFGQAVITTGAVERTFTITNAGTAPLNLSGTPIVLIAGPQAGEFTVVTQPVTPIAPAGTATFVIRFAPAAAGARNATVSIENDSSENPYDFAIAGTGQDAGSQIRITGISTDPVTGNVVLRWEGGEPQFQVEKAGAVTGVFQSLGTAQSERTYTDTGALNSGVQNFYRIRQGSASTEK